MCVKHYNYCGQQGRCWLFYQNLTIYCHTCSIPDNHFTTKAVSLLPSSTCCASAVTPELAAMAMSQEAWTANKSPLKINGWKTRFPFEMAYFHRGTMFVSGRGRKENLTLSVKHCGHKEPPFTKLEILTKIFQSIFGVGVSTPKHILKE